MSRYHRAINRHYGHVDMRRRILDMLRAAGKNPQCLTRDDLTSFDEFHTGGRASTRELARLARLTPGMRVLDIGSGVGGPARTLAAEFDCFVAAMDLTEEFCQAGTMLTALVNLSNRVMFLQGDALTLPFRDAAFDIVWSQNTIMNVPDKNTLFAGVHRILRSGGRFALECVCSGTAQGIYYPTFWASSREIDFLSQPDETLAVLESVGFEKEVWEDNSANVLARAQQRKASVTDEKRKPVLGREVIVAEDIALKMTNAIRNNEEHRVSMIRAVFRRT